MIDSELSPTMKLPLSIASIIPELTPFIRNKRLLGNLRGLRLADFCCDKPPTVDAQLDQDCTE